MFDAAWPWLAVLTDLVQVSPGSCSLGVKLGLKAEASNKITGEFTQVIDIIMVINRMELFDVLRSLACS